MWSDIETQSDYLNYLEIAEIVSDVLLDPTMRPVSVGIFGTWGTGKSSLLNLIEADLKKRKNDDVVVIRFDAWLYQGFDDARAALMDVIARALYEEAKKKAGLLGIAERLLARVNTVRTLGLAMEVIAAANGVPVFGAAARATEALGNYFKGTPDDDDAKALADGGQKVRGLIEPEKNKSPPQEIDAFRAEFSELLAKLEKIIIVFVDNLDRCLPTQTIHTLEALRLFLFMESSAFVVAADEDMVRHSVSQHFRDADTRHVKDYLDKLIQVPVRVPRLGVAEIRAYLFMLFANASDTDKKAVEQLRNRLETNLRLSWKEAPLSIEDALAVLGNKGNELRNSFDVADRMAALLANAPLVDGNPRIVKRMLNVVRLRSRIAERRKMPVDEQMVAKFALFERCVEPAAITKMYLLINEAPSGKPALITELERLRDDPHKFTDACPDEWKKNATFLIDWFGLSPALGTLDLRPMVYLRIVDELDLQPGFENTKRHYYCPLISLLIKPPISATEVSSQVVAAFSEFRIKRFSAEKFQKAYEARKAFATYRSRYAPPDEYTLNMLHQNSTESVFENSDYSIPSRLYLLGLLFYEAMFARNLDAMSMFARLSRDLLKRKSLVKEFGVPRIRILRREFRERILDYVFEQPGRRGSIPRLSNKDVGGALLSLEEAASAEEYISCYKRYERHLDIEFEKLKRSLPTPGVQG